jgi:hypothetical protein
MWESAGQSDGVTPAEVAVLSYFKRAHVPPLAASSQRVQITIMPRVFIANVKGLFSAMHMPEGEEVGVPRTPRQPRFRQENRCLDLRLNRHKKRTICRR